VDFQHFTPIARFSLTEPHDRGASQHGSMD
jgi:hypothetical protein